MNWRFFAIIGFGFWWVACEPNSRVTPTSEPYDLVLPAHFPQPTIPEDNKLTADRVALGRQLFFDPILSKDYSIACVDCHRPELAFTDGEKLSAGVEGRLGFRNSPTLVNLAYATAVNKDGGVPKLDLQAMVPIEDHSEMDLSVLVVAERLNSDAHYRQLFQKAYDQAANPFTITRALGAFLRTLISGNSPYDQYVLGERQLSEAALRGLQLFESERLQCSSCHSGFNFTNEEFLNNGLAPDSKDLGRARVTSLASDEGKFRVPTLRNIALTAPYFHDGSVPDLISVVEHYDGGGAQHPNQDPRIRALQLTAQEKSDLVEFLRQLTDESFVRREF